AWLLRRARWPPRHVVAGRSSTPRGYYLHRARGAHLPTVPARPSVRKTATPLRILGAHSARASAHTARSHSTTPIPGAELDCRLARLPASLHLLLQGRVLRGRALVLHPARRRRTC